MSKGIGIEEMNLMVVELEANVLSAVNSSGLPPEIKRLVLFEVMEHTKIASIEATKYAKVKKMKSLAKERGVHNGTT